MMTGTAFHVIIEYGIIIDNLVVYRIWDKHSDVVAGRYTGGKEARVIGG